ncbi:MAG: serine hydrolase [Clostridia bacterium]|nr:serine hydrolase [Clostridia bacterium]
MPAENVWYHVASIAKMVTAVGALKMVDLGLLKLDEPILDYSNLPLPPQVTLRHLLTHTSGIIDGVGYDKAVAQRLALEQWFNADEYSSGHRPGSHFQYSNLGFGLVGSLMEEASGECLQQWMQQHLFAPLGMAATYDLALLPKADELTSCKRLFPPRRGYQLDASRRIASARPLGCADPSAHYGLAAGGLFTTADGLGKLLSLLASSGKGILTSRSYQQMVTPATIQNFGKYSCGFGMGVFCVQNPRGQLFYGHQGFAYGAVQGAFWDPQNGNWIVSLNGGADESRMGRLGRTNLDVLNLFLGGCRWI